MMHVCGKMFISHSSAQLYHLGYSHFVIFCSRCCLSLIVQYSLMVLSILIVVFYRCSLLVKPLLLLFNVYYLHLLMMQIKSSCLNVIPILALTGSAVCSVLLALVLFDMYFNAPTDSYFEEIFDNSCVLTEDSLCSNTMATGFSYLFSLIFKHLHG